MKSALILVAALLATVASAQEEQRPHQSPVQALREEPHHKLMFQNDAVRVYQLQLQPHEVTNRHRHEAFYTYVSLTPVTIGNEVRGRQTVETALEANEVRTSKGGFNLAERNLSSQPASLIVIELVRPNTGLFSTPLGGFRLHDAAFGELFETSSVRAYTMTIAAEGRTDPYSEKYDRLILALSDLTLQDNVNGEKPAKLELKRGEVRWVTRGATHAITNVGTQPATFITVEFGIDQS
jgi:quercetin dioxygenase-like cupin family protein